MKTNVLIAVPAYGGSIINETMASLIGTMNAFAANGVKCSMKLIDQTDIAYVRDVFASFILQDETYSHVLFVDSDMDYRPEAAVRLLSFDKDVIGLAARQRNEVVKYNLEFDPANPQSAGSLIKPLHLGMGVTLVSRKALLRMIESGIVSEENHTHQHGLHGKLYDFFFQIKVNNRRLLEDYSFCHKWRSIGGEVFAVIDETVGHIGRMNYKGRLADIGQTVTEKSSQTPTRQHTQRR